MALALGSTRSSNPLLHDHIIRRCRSSFQAHNIEGPLEKNLFSQNSFIDHASARPVVTYVFWSLSTEMKELGRPASVLHQVCKGTYTTHKSVSTISKEHI